MVFFEENSAKIDKFELLSLKQFLNAHKSLKNVSITLIGYADGCGDAKYNKNLAKRRAEAVQHYARQVLPKVPVEVVIAGEITDAHTVAALRVDVLIHTLSALRRKIEKVKADVYLIDASGSMWNSWRDWQDVINASIRPGSRVYVSMMTGCQNNQSLSTIKPQSGTEIWYSYWTVLDNMRPGQTLAIISDLQSNYPLTKGEAVQIKAKAKNKNINVIVIQ